MICLVSQRCPIEMLSVQRTIRHAASGPQEVGWHVGRYQEEYARPMPHGFSVEVLVRVPAQDHDRFLSTGKSATTMSARSYTKSL